MWQMWCVDFDCVSYMCFGQYGCVLDDDFVLVMIDKDGCFMFQCIKQFGQICYECVYGVGCFVCWIV